MKINSQIPYPKGNTKVTIKKLKSGIYVYYETGRTYNNVTKHTTPIRKCIGKKVDENSDFIVPNSNYYELFPLANLDEKLEKENIRSSALAIGAFIAIKKISQNLELDTCMSSAITNDIERGLFFDFLAYEIICKTNVAQHFHAYAYKHPLFTPNMDIYSDSSLSKLFRKITCDQKQVFLNCWNSKTDKKIEYIFHMIQRIDILKLVILKKQNMEKLKMG